MITRIELTNFMSHRHTVIEPARGLTVLVGPNNCGKSAVITALQILANNENSTYVIRHGEKHSCVTVNTDDGHEITWQRKNSSTSYVIDGKLFDRLRNGVPEELKQTLRLPKVELNSSNDQVDIHFGTQKQPVFLLNESGKTAAGFFAASSDAGRLIEMQRVHKDRVRSQKQDASRLEVETETLQDEVDKLSGVGEQVELLASCEQNKLQFLAGVQRTEQLSALITKALSLKKEQSRCSKQQEIFNNLQFAPSMAPTQELSSIIEKSKMLTTRKQVLTNIANATAAIVTPPELPDTQTLQTILAEVQTLSRRKKLAEREANLLEKLPMTPELSDLESARKLCRESLFLKNKKGQLDSESLELAASLDSVESDIQNLVDSNSTCPTCLQPLDADSLVRHLKTSRDCNET